MICLIGVHPRSSAADNFVFSAADERQETPMISLLPSGQRYLERRRRGAARAGVTCSFAPSLFLVCYLLSLASGLGAIPDRLRNEKS
jgi:hypothetical protein